MNRDQNTTMILLLSTRYRKFIASLLAFIFYLSVAVPAYGINHMPEPGFHRYWSASSGSSIKKNIYPGMTGARMHEPVAKVNAAAKTEIETEVIHKEKTLRETPDKKDIDGPGQPEMASFKSAGTSDMVNLFTGDFSYNIPLLDVGGYPVNIYYSGGISMEQEASWVGLGWNINPGNVSRNMRGVPDDFNGEEKMIQQQNMKKNITWGIGIGADIELVGIKGMWTQAFSGGVGANVGYSLNNYLGPAIELGLKGTTSFRVGAKGISEKGPVGVSAGLSATMNSRSGLTLTPNLSLSAKSAISGSTLSTGLGLSTSYNSRTGIKALQITNTVSMGYDLVKGRNDKENVRGATESNSSMSASLMGSTISFTKPSYIPSLRSPITNVSGAGRFQLGGGMLGVFSSVEAEGYAQISSIEPADRVLSKPMVGFMYAEKSNNNREAVMDFTRFNDQEVTPSTTVISVPQYAYDVFSIQGEGTGGTIRAYRNDNGYVRDNYTVSRDKSWSAGVDVGIPGHVGGNFNTVKSPSTIGEWNNGNSLKYLTGFRNASGTTENLYFRNPGENSVLNPNQYDSIGGLNLVRFRIGGSDAFPVLEPKLQIMSGSGAVLAEQPVQRGTGIPERKKRTQVTSFLNAEEASLVGLDKKIKVYNPVPASFLDNQNRLSVIEEISRVSGDRKAHHISQINVTETDGKRYVYGIPVYNTKQIDFTFSVADNCSDCDEVAFATNETITDNSNPHMSTKVGGKDGYVQITETPAYSHSFLLSGLLSPDYVDVTGDGITEDDMGGSVKFNYTKTGIHKWRTPLSNGLMANSNPGNLSETRDDKAIISYGERESWYLQSVESKTMIAFFTLGSRSDGKGVTSEFGSIDYLDNSVRKLERIDLYNKADLKKNGLANTKPVKSVHFGYNYSLCPNTRDNQNGGKLTLEKIWFTYNGQRENAQKKNQYVFAYTKNATPVAGENPGYAFNASDRWGNYKPKEENPLGENAQPVMNRNYPYALQDKTKADQYAGSWALKKILLPSGGQLEVQYESDDYAFVQNKRAAGMMRIIGFGSSENAPTSMLYTVNGSSVTENDYVFIQVPVACTSKQEVYTRYLDGLKQLLVKMKVNMPKGPEYMTAYATVVDYGVYTPATGNGIWVRINKVEDRGKYYTPLSMTAVEFIRERLPAQAFRAYDVTEETGLDKLEKLFGGLIEGIKTTFSRIPEYLREKGKAQTVQLAETFARLNTPDGYKYGGGHRVKRITMKDNWDRMTLQYGSVFGQEYDYSTVENFNGTERVISSGVASYEPSIGGEENPFQSIVQVANQVPLGPTSYGAIEMPVMDAFFPSPLVGYSKVTVTSIGKRQNPDTLNKKTRSAVGRQVTEFYTAKDFPVYFDNTPIDPSSNKELHINPTLNFWFKYAYDSRAITQGFIVATNDMHGKMRSQSSYAENDPNTRINYTENFYRNTGSKGLDEKFDFIHNNLGGEIMPGNMGIDVELMTDTREFKLRTSSIEIQGQVDWMLPPPFPLWLPFIWPVSSESENIYRAVTTTKVISYHSVVDSVVVIDKGSQVTTKNLVYDAETGQVVLNRTNNEFDKSIYSVSYPAYWAYSGMGLAYKNIDAVYTGVNFEDGRITSNNVPVSVFESGDELFITNPGIQSGCNPVIMASPANKTRVWAMDINKNSGSLTNPNPDYIFIDSSGKPYSRSGTSFRIIRSGKRNMPGASLASVALMENPVDPVTHKFTYTAQSKIINSSAVVYKEKWQSDADVFRNFKSTTDPVTCVVTESEDCAGYLERKINPYVKGLLGNFKAFRNMVFYGERDNISHQNPLSTTNLPQNGFLSGFTPFWNFNASNNLIPDLANTKWVWNTEATRFNSKGMELETRDALLIYTAAQYGYRKTFPVAIANNSRYGEMVYEGFEDQGYSDLLSSAAYYDCTAPYFSVTDVEAGLVVSNSQAGLSAHSGKSMLAVNKTYQKQFPVSTGYNESFNLQFQQTTVESLIGAGANSFAAENCNGNNSVAIPGNTHMAALNEYTALNIGYCPDYTFRFYLKATVTSSFGFNSFIKENGGSYTLTIYEVNDLAGPHTPVYTFSQEEVLNGAPQADINNSFNLSFCSGKYYMVEMIYHPNPLFVNYPYYWSGNPTPYWAGITYYSSGLEEYESLQSQSGVCNYTKPIPAHVNMSNPVFSIPAGKKMLFSAWVRESVVTTGGYTNTEVQVDFGNGNPANAVLKPAGPVIEGWQRIEGYFTAPQEVTQLNLRMINNSGGIVYYDDIRFHPYHANMKSYVYDPVNLRLTAQLDPNNYASYYEYDEEGTLIRTKVETKQGIKTITESRSARQKNIQGFE